MCSQHSYMWLCACNLQCVYNIPTCGNVHVIYKNFTMFNVHDVLATCNEHHAVFCLIHSTSSTTTRFQWHALHRLFLRLAMFFCAAALHRLWFALLSSRLLVLGRFALFRWLSVVRSKALQKRCHFVVAALLTTAVLVFSVRLFFIRRGRD